MNPDPRSHPAHMPPTGHRASGERIKKFRRIYKETYGEEITLPDASEMTHWLLALYTLVLRPLPGESSEHLPEQPPLAQTSDEAS